MTISGHVYHVAAGQPLLSLLAAHILANHCGDDPLQLADVTVWLPSQRAVKALRDAFVAQAGQGLVLPRLRAMQLTESEQDALDFSEMPQVDELTPAVAKMARLMFLVEQIVARDSHLSHENAFAAALALTRLLDRLHSHDVPLAKLRDVVPTELAGHWQKNLEFLDVALKSYPAWLRAQQATDPAEFRNQLLRTEAARLEAEGLSGPTYAAGFADTIPAGVELLKAILAQPQGVVVIPGEPLDIERLPPTHAAYSLHRLLQDLDVTHTRRLGAAPSARASLWKQALLPAGYTETWLTTPLPENALDGLSLIEAANSREEADVIALLMRETLATAYKTCALVTPRRALGRRVAEKLASWGVQVNDSGGESLLARPAGSFMLVLLEALAQNFRPLALAALIHHPMARFGYKPGDWRRRARALDAAVLRGPLPEPGLAGLRKRLANITAEGRLPEGLLADAAGALDDIEKVLAAVKTNAVPAAEWIERHVQLASRVAAGENGEDADRFLQDDDGEALTTLLQEWRTHASSQALAVATYRRWFQTLAAEQMVRLKGGQHPRLFIWGPLEARGQQVDRIILGAVNEGDWPNAPTPDPWLGQRIGVELGLPPLEIAMGLNAHDFWLLASMPEVVMTRAKRSEGTDNLPSRFLERLRARLEAREGGADLWQKLLQSGAPYLQICRTLAAQGETALLPPAQLAVPPQLRPLRWSASLIKTLVQCPYRAALERVFRVTSLAPYEEKPDAADRGELMHLMLEAFYQNREDQGLPPPFAQSLTAQNREAAIAHLKAIGDAVLARLSAPSVKAIWRERFHGAAAAFIDEQLALLATGRKVRGVETSAKWQLDNVQVEARMDRVDSTAEGLVVLDYKTGQIPTKKDVAQGLEPQLVVEALLLQKQQQSVADIEYWRVGGTIGVERRSACGQKNDLDEMMNAAEDGIQRLKTHVIDNAADLPALPGGESPLTRDGICRTCEFSGICRFPEWVQEVSA